MKEGYQVSEPQSTPRRWLVAPLLAFVSFAVAGIVPLLLTSGTDEPLAAAMAGNPLTLGAWSIVAIPLVYIFLAMLRDLLSGGQGSVPLLRAGVAALLLISALPLTIALLLSGVPVLQAAGVLYPFFIVASSAAFAWVAPRAPTERAHSSAIRSLASARIGIAGYLGFGLPFVIASIVFYIQFPREPAPGDRFPPPPFPVAAILSIALVLFLGLFLAAPLGGVLGGWLRRGYDTERRGETEV